MPLSNEQTATVAAALTAAGFSPITTEATTTPAKRTTVKRAAKLAAPKADKPAKQPEAVAKPAKPAADTGKLEASRLARAVAVAAVSAYYNGASIPFKAASDRFADLRTDKLAKKPSLRQAALIAVMLAADTAGNIKRNGTFTRGAFVLPAKLFNPKAGAGETVTCQPETGCLSDMLGRTVQYVSGPTSGAGQRDTVLRLDFKAARADLALLGGPLSRAAVAVLDKLQAKAA